MITVVDRSDEVDGWGNSFPPYSQMYHLTAIRAALERFEMEKVLKVTQLAQCEWKDLPAGSWDKTPKDNQSLDG